MAMARSGHRLGMANLIVENNPEEDEDSCISIAPNNLYRLTDLKSGDRHFKEIIADFENSCLTVVKIQKLENMTTSKTFQGNKSIMLETKLKLDPTFKLNEKYLYHGTSANLKDICELGLDDKLAGNGCFGKGIYLSDNPKKCTKYADGRAGEEGVILCVRAILGDVKVYPPGKQDRSLRREPEKTSNFKGHRFYDSVQGCPTKYTEFVVYRAQKLIIEYLITYHKSASKCTSECSVTSQRSMPLKLGTGDADILNDSSSDTDDDDVVNDPDLLSSSDEADDVQSSLKKGSDTEGDEDSDDLTKAKSQTHSMIGEAERLLAQKRNEFSRLTREFNEYVVETFLQHADFDVQLAAELYHKKKKNDTIHRNHATVKEEEKDEEATGGDSEPAFVQGKTVPDFNSIEWRKMNDDDQEAVINVLVDNFLSITSLSDENSLLARKILRQTQYNLDQAIVVYYESL